MMIYILLIFAVTCFHHSLVSGDCKLVPDELIKPCHCQEEETSVEGQSVQTLIKIVCSTNEAIDLAKVFGKLSKFKIRDRTFDALVVSSPGIVEIKKNATKLAIFKAIELDAPNLKRINSEAFCGTAANIKRFVVGESMKKLDDHDEFDFFKLINSLNNLERVEINSPIFDTIPTQAIKEMPQLQTFQLDFGYNDSHPDDRTTCLKVDDDAFINAPDQPFRLRLMNARLKKITSKMFNLKTASSRFVVNVFGNGLTENDFEAGCFEPINRPCYLNLRSNPIKYLDEKIFKPLLDAYDENKIEALEVSFECEHKNNKWWLKSGEYSKKVEQDKCKVKRRDEEEDGDDALDPF